MATPRKKPIKVRGWRAEDIPGIIACHAAAYPDYPPHAHYDARLLEMEFAAFPEGQFLAEQDGRVIGYCTSIIVQLDDDGHLYTYNEITGHGTFSTHHPAGDTLYGVDIAVHPDFRGRGIAARMYKLRMRLLKKYNLRRMVAYGRIPGYRAHAGKMTPEQYVKRVTEGSLKDAALNAHLKAGYEVKRVLVDFVRDQSSMNYATLLELPNPDHRAERRQIAAAPLKRPVRRVRVCAAQYLMRPVKSWEEFVRDVDFFVDTADYYHCHFLVLPEFFTAQLFSLMPSDWTDRRAMEELANMTDRYEALFREMAQRHRMYIVAGSQPVWREGELYNVAHLFTPTGQLFTQDKLHITPGERESYGILPGEGIRIFDTPLARVAIQVCYDIEFPEVARLLAQQGVEIIFVPFSTDEKKAYFRVRYCAHARAVENYIYVVIAGNVGNLPSTHYLLNYGQSAILTPSDFAFPVEGIAGEADRNAETVVIAELDLSSLATQRELGNVRPYYDRRPDLYELRAREQIEVVRVDE